MIVTLALIVFWFSVGLMFHSYALYPVLLRLFATGKKQNDVTYTLTDTELPDVYVVFAVYNEERVIREKLESLFNTNYPPAKLKVYIGSDNSSDATNGIIQEFAALHPQLVFYPYKDRNGKAKILNRLVGEIKAKGHSANAVFVFTDANVFFTPTTLFELAKHFRNTGIAQVAANILNKGVRADGISHQEKSYIQRENHVKYLEGLNWGSMMGAFGACYAMRAGAWTDIPANYLMEDFYLSMHILKGGGKAIMELNAICYEDVSNEVRTWSTRGRFRRTRSS